MKKTVVKTKKQMNKVSGADDMVHHCAGKIFMHTHISYITCTFSVLTACESIINSYVLWHL